VVFDTIEIIIYFPWEGRNMNQFSKTICFSILIGAFVVSCKEDSSDSEKGKVVPVESGSNEATPNVTTTTGKTYYAGFDGVNNYGILVRERGATLSLADSSVASITPQNITLDQATIDSLIASANIPADRLERFKGFIGREQTAYLITPTKTGTTSIVVSGGRGGPGGGAGAGFGTETAQQTINLVVNSYSSEDYTAGSTRYNTDGTGDQKSCKSCHETGEQNAPPHELGNIKTGTDATILTWLTTGVQPGKTVDFHRWGGITGVANMEKGIVAFLRAKASKNVEEFARLVFEEMLESFNTN